MPASCALAKTFCEKKARKVSTTDHLKSPWICLPILRKQIVKEIRKQARDACTLPLGKSTHPYCAASDTCF